VHSFLTPSGQTIPAGTEVMLGTDSPTLLYGTEQVPMLLLKAAVSIEPIVTEQSDTPSLDSDALTAEVATLTDDLATVTDELVNVSEERDALLAIPRTVIGLSMDSSIANPAVLNKATIYTKGGPVLYLINAVLNDVIFFMHDTMDRNLAGANLTDVTFNRAADAVGNVGMPGSNWAGIICQNVEFNITTISGTSLANAVLNHVSFEGLEMTGCNLAFNLNNTLNFKGANLNSSSLKPAYNTKAAFIAAVGAGNVNAQTIWTNGTSILA
jgi:uncharacterized protein YjbI with pentapeptide repeats